MTIGHNAPPAVTKVAIIYGTKSGILRRKIVPSLDDSELAAHPPLTGESVLHLPIDAVYDDATCKTAVMVATGLPSVPSGRCAVVVDGVVVGVCHADPEIDQHPEGVLILHDSAGVGDVLA